MLSAGTLPARIGHAEFRSGLLGSDRKAAYPCLFDLLKFVKPSPSLVLLISWYSRLYHSTTCEPVGGRRAIRAV